MAHEKSGARDRKFGYPPIPSVYGNSVSTLGGLQGTALMENTEPEPSRYPDPGHYASASFTPSPYAFSYPDNVDDNAPIYNAPSISPALSSDYSYLAPSIFTGHELSIRNPANITSTAQKRSPRGATGDVVCDECGYKFTFKSSLYRHRKICRGKKSSRKQLAQPKSMKTKGLGLHSNNTDAMSVTETQRNQQDNKDQDAGNIGNHEKISTTNNMIESQGPSKASSTSNSTPPMSYQQWPLATQPYVPRGPDTSEDHTSFRCDLCLVIFARRDILQMHKAQVHGMTEAPFLPESGIMNTPPYLEGVTLEGSSYHSQQALRIFHGGALSSSPCQPCLLRGEECIVNPFLSSRCARCSYSDNGSYCGAAGVKYRYVSSEALSPDSLR